MEYKRRVSPILKRRESDIYEPPISADRCPQNCQDIQLTFVVSSTFDNSFKLLKNLILDL